MGRELKSTVHDVMGHTALWQDERDYYIETDAMAFAIVSKYMEADKQELIQIMATEVLKKKNEDEEKEETDNKNEIHKIIDCFDECEDDEFKLRELFYDNSDYRDHYMRIELNEDITLGLPPYVINKMEVDNTQKIVLLPNSTPFSIHVRSGKISSNGHLAMPNEATGLESRVTVVSSNRELMASHHYGKPVAVKLKKLVHHTKFCHIPFEVQLLCYDRDKYFRNAISLYSLTAGCDCLNYFLSKLKKKNIKIKKAKRKFRGRLVDAVFPTEAEALHDIVFDYLIWLSRYADKYHLQLNFLHHLVRDMNPEGRKLVACDVVI